DVSNVQWMRDHAGTDFVSEEPLQNVFIHGQSALREDGIAQFLELFHDLVIESGIVMVWPPEHDDADTILALKLIEHFARLPAQSSLVILQRFESSLDGTLIFLFRNTKDWRPGFKHLVSKQLAVGKVQNRIEICNSIFGKDVSLFREGGFDCTRSRCDCRAGVRATGLYQW